jgi:hypothetical protein
MLTLNATVRPSSLEPHSSGSGFATSALEVLDLGNSSINDPLRVAVWLGDICSADKLVRPNSAREDTGTVLGLRYIFWRKAREYLRPMQEVRKAEKEKAAGAIRRLEAEIAALKAGGGQHPTS